jgi:hypothetical protein
VTCPFSIYHHINICLDMSISCIRSNVNHFFGQQKNFDQTNFNNLKTLIANFSPPHQASKKIQSWNQIIEKIWSPPKKKFDCSQKTIVVQLMVVQFPPLNQLQPNIFYGCPKNLVTKLGDWNFLLVIWKGLIIESSNDFFLISTWNCF